MKNRKTYKTLCIFGGFLGLHKFYVEKYGIGVLYLCTAGGLFVGWFHDVLHMSGDFDRYMAERGYIKHSS